MANLIVLGVLVIVILILTLLTGIAIWAGDREPSTDRTAKDHVPDPIADTPGSSTRPRQHLHLSATQQLDHQL
jgi:hypothetical protein